MLKPLMLKKNKDFNYVYHHSSSVPSEYVVLLYVKNRMGPKIGFSVSKKLGNAVIRNHVKRLFREAITGYLPFLEQKYSYVFLARAKAADATYQSIQEDMRRVLVKAGLLKEGPQL